MVLEEKQKEIVEKITDSMKSIFSFSLSRTHNATEAEDLSQQIIVELLSSCHHLKDVNAFYGWMWSVAKNTYGKYVRAQNKEKNNIEFSVNENDVYYNITDSKSNIEKNLILKEDTNLLRREMSLLTQQYREAVVKYYLEDKSCAQISKELSVTVETVKHLLFKARKILKEGINMTREYGEKSYNPGIFRLDKWIKLGFTPEIHEIERLFDTRKLPGNILLSAYYTPLTMDEISMELGVAVPYLEDEIKVLLHYNLLRQFQNGRYQTNIFIYTTACQEDTMLKTKALYKKHSEKLSSLVDNKISEVKELIFKNTDASQNKLKWFTSHFILWHAAMKNQKDLEFPVLQGGSEVYFWGMNYDYSEYSHGFNGISGSQGSERYSDWGWIHIANYKLLEKTQVRLGGVKEYIDFLLAAAHKRFDDFKPDEIAQYLQWEFIEKDGDTYKSLCNVMTQAQHDKLIEICSSEIDEIASALSETLAVILEVMTNHAPSAVQEQTKDISVINSSFKNMACIMESLCDSGYLTMPTRHDFLTIYTVI